MVRRVERIDVIATTISGSVSDWQKVSNLEGEFRKYYSGPLEVHAVGSHAAARSKTAELVSSGSRVLVSAGGAGTFNSVLEGCWSEKGIPDDVRLAFLRKGSADLVGKALKIPDDLSSSVREIFDGICEDRVVNANIIRVSSGRGERHFIGFSGVGVFGEIPKFTENPLVKYYKGFLGSLFGDLGPFMVGANIALIKHHLEGILGRTEVLEIRADEKTLPKAKYISVLVMNGDLGKDLPLAKEVELGSGDFKVIAIHDRGVAASYVQLDSCRKGRIYDRPDELGIQPLRTTKLTILPGSPAPYMVNVDGLLAWATGPLDYSVCGSVRLIGGRQTPGKKALQ
jgi:diacylglycerol kinase family enzyme